MLRPSEMTRVLIVGPSDKLEGVIDTLYDLGILHIIDHEGEDDVFKIGKPLKKASEISESLIKLRSISSILKIPPEVEAEGSVGPDLRDRIASLELSISEEDSARKKIEALLSDLGRQIEEVRPFAMLGLALEDYKGYESIDVIVGRVGREIEDLSEVSPNLLLVRGGEHAAIFVAKNDSEIVRDYLARTNFSRIDVPIGEGDPAARLVELESEVAKWKQRLSEIESRLTTLREKYAGFIAAAERKLDVEVEKAEAPLRFAMSDHTFVIDGWIPFSESDELELSLREMKDVFVSGLEQDEHSEPPVKLDNPRPARPFEMLIHLFSTPSYHELDPTLLVAFVFPVFFGFMIGDAGYGLVWLFFGAFLLHKKRYEGIATFFGLKDSRELRDLILVVVLGGFFALVFGLFVFAEAFGIPFHSPLAAAAEGGSGELVAENGEAAASWETMFGINLPFYSVFHKLTDVIDMILLSLLAALVHLAVGFVFGAVNEWPHNKKHSIAKVAWLLILFGLFTFIFARAWGANIRVADAVWSNILFWFPRDGMLMESLGFVEVTGMGSRTIPFVSLGLLVGSAGVLAVTEGPLAPIEIIGLLANMISYSRLAGIAVAKAATAEAFNAIVFSIVTGGVLFVIPALLLAFAFHTIIFLLGALSAGIQAIRLNYVECFLKFFKGNGTLFRPFGGRPTQEV